MDWLRQNEVDEKEVAVVDNVSTDRVSVASGGRLDVVAKRAQTHRARLYRQVATASRESSKQVR